MEVCWAQKPEDRPGLEHVLELLDAVVERRQSRLDVGGMGGSSGDDNYFDHISDSSEDSSSPRTNSRAGPEAANDGAVVEMRARNHKLWKQTRGLFKMSRKWNERTFRLLGSTTSINDELKKSHNPPMLEWERQTIKNAFRSIRLTPDTRVSKTGSKIIHRGQNIHCFVVKVGKKKLKIGAVDEDRVDRWVARIQKVVDDFRSCLALCHIDEQVSISSPTATAARMLRRASSVGIQSYHQPPPDKCDPLESVLEAKDEHEDGGTFDEENTRRGERGSVGSAKDERSSLMLFNGLLRKKPPQAEEVLRLCEEWQQELTRLDDSLVAQEEQNQPDGGSGRLLLEANHTTWNTQREQCVRVAYFYQGYALQTLGKLLGSANAFIECVRLDPTELTAQKCLLASLHGMHQHQAYRELRVFIDGVDDKGADVLLPPLRAELEVFRGSVLQSEQATDAALAAYELAVKLNPTLCQGHMGRGDCLLNRGDYAEAVAAYVGAVAVATPGDSRNQCIRAQCRGLGQQIFACCSKSEDAIAISAFNDYCRMMSKVPSLAQCLSATNDNKASDADTDDELFSPFYLAVLRYQVALCHYRDGQTPETATILLREATKQYPSLYDAWRDLGIIMNETGALDEARDAFVAAAKLCPANSHLPPLNTTTAAREETSDEAKAVASQEETNERGGDRERRRIQRWGSSSAGDKRTNASSMQATHHMTLYSLGLVYVNLDEPALALERFDEAIDYAHGNLWKAHYAKGVTLMTLGEFRGAAEAFKRGKDADEDDGMTDQHIDFQYNAGIADFHLSRHGDARCALARALTLVDGGAASSDSVPAIQILPVLAVTCMNEGCFEDAVGYLKRSLDPDNGAAFVQSDNDGKAQDREDDHDLTVVFNLAVCYLRLEMHAESLSWFSRVANVAPDNVDAKKAITFLRVTLEEHEGVVGDKVDDHPASSNALVENIRPMNPPYVRSPSMSSLRVSRMSSFMSDDSGKESLDDTSLGAVSVEETDDRAQ
jgi:tetratricopeptide (TPR) repeat protein